MYGWPSTLPTYPDDGSYSETPHNLVVISRPEIGPPKIRKRSTSGPIRVEARYTLTATQAATFASFFNYYTEGGSERFIWPHPRLEYNVEAAFIDVPSLNNIGYDRYTVNVELELTNETEIAG